MSGVSARHLGESRGSKAETPDGTAPVQVPIVPDGFFGLRTQDKDFFCMLEVDRATAPLTRIRTKLEA
ncbi:MAG: hypothetical protein AB1644_05570 [Candidatus Zixiibacteriota bacterium]